MVLRMIVKIIVKIEEVLRVVHVSRISSGPATEMLGNHPSPAR